MITPSLENSNLRLDDVISFIDEEVRVIEIYLPQFLQ